MSDVLAIDLAPSLDDPTAFEVSLATRVALPDPPVLQVDVLDELDGELTWQPAIQDGLREGISGFTHVEHDGRHYYTVKTWRCTGALQGATYRLAYASEAGTVVSHEVFSVHAPQEDLEPTSPVTGEDGDSRAGPTTLGTTFLSVPLALRLVAGETAIKRAKGGGELLAAYVHRGAKDYAPIADKDVAITFATASPGAPGLFEWTTWLLRSDADGWLYDPTLGEDRPDRGSLRFNSPFMKIESGRVKPSVSFFYVLVDDDVAGLKRRAALIQAAHSRRRAAGKKDPWTADRVYRETVRLLVDSFFDERGRLPAHAMFEPPAGPDGAPYTRKLSDELEVRALFVPVRVSQFGRFLELLDFAGDGATLVEQAWAMPEGATDELLDHDAVRLAITEDTAAARALIERARAYFKEHPDALLPDAKGQAWLGRMPMRKVADELLTAVLLTVRKEFLAKAGGGIAELEEVDLPEVVKKAEEQLGRVVRGLLLALLLGAYRHLRLDVAYVLGERMLDNLLATYRQVFGEFEETLGLHDDAEALAKRAAPEQLGALAINLLATYYIESARASRSHAAEKAFKVAFRGALLPLGLYDRGDGKNPDDPDNEALRIIQTLDVYAKRLRLEPSLLGRIAAGTEVKYSPLRELLRAPLARAAVAACHQRELLWTHEVVDIYKQWSLFRDYPVLTGLVHDAYRIDALDPADHPNGDGLGERPGWSKLKKLTFTECAMTVGGRAMESRDDQVELMVKLFELAIGLLTPELVLVGGGKLLYNALTAVGESVFEIALAQGKVQNAYERAMVGLGSLEGAKKASARAKLEAVLDLALKATNLGLEAKGRGGLSWPHLGQIYDAEVLKKGRAGGVTLLRRVVDPLTRRMVKHRGTYLALSKAMGQVIDFAYDHASKFAFDKLLTTLKEDGVLPHTGVKSLFEALAIELAMRDVLDVPLGKELDWKPLEDALAQLERTMKDVEAANRKNK